jgi:hypothetical protein
MVFESSSAIDKFLINMRDEPPSEFDIVPNTIAIKGGEVKSYPVYFPLTKDRSSLDVSFLKPISIGSVEPGLFVLGFVHYEDIFGDFHETIFCWRYEPHYAFLPDKKSDRNKRT